jgi:FkbM family methyltransferase
MPMNYSHIATVINRVHKLLGRSKFATHCAIKLRNQCNAIIGCHLSGQNHDCRYNGEMLLSNLLAPASETFVDVGANYGEWTASFLESMPHEKRRGLCFEPSVVTAEYLQRRFKHLPEVEILLMGVGEACEDKELFINDDCSKVASFVDQSRFANTHIVATRIGAPVHITTLDKICLEKGWGRIDVLKIDAEGFDCHVLQGASSLLSQQAIGVIQFEYGGSWRSAGKTLAVALTLLERCGYSCFLLKGDGLHLVDYDIYGEHFLYCNYVAVSPKWLPKLQAYLPSSRQTG